MPDPKLLQDLLLEQYPDSSNTLPIPDMNAQEEQMYLDDAIAKYEQELMYGLATFNQY
jgi:hypothetical protein